MFVHFTKNDFLFLDGQVQKYCTWVLVKEMVSREMGDLEWLLVG
jgi:hypothetical protein